MSSPAGIGVQAFRRTIALEPSFTEAYLGLAETLHRTGVVDPMSESAVQRVEEAREAVQNALALEPTLAFAYVVLARLQIDQWELGEAENNLRLALRLQPDSVAARRAYAWLLSARGQHVAAEANASRAVELDRRCPDGYLELAAILYYAQKPEGSVRTLEKVSDLLPDVMQSAAWFFFYRAYELMGQEQRAFDYLQRAFAAWGMSQEEIATLNLHFRREGLIGVYRSCAASESPMPIERRAVCFARIGAREEALMLLEQMVEQRNPNSVLLSVEPSYQTLHGHPRFRALLERVGL